MAGGGFTLLLGLENASAETCVVGRIAGAAILSIGVLSWLVRSNLPETAQLAVVSSIGTYTVAAAALLTYASTSLAMGGIALWPAVIFHSLLGVWCLACVGRSDWFTSGHPFT
jgi:hypothetical protein